MAQEAKILQQTTGYVVGGGLKTTEVSLSALDKAFPELFGSKASELTASSAYSIVSWVYRCVNLRADIISNLPRNFYAVGSDEPTDDIPAPYQDIDLDRLLWLTEAARCLWGVAYWEKAQGLPWLNPMTISIEKRGGELAGFRQHTQGGRAEEFTPEELVYLPLFNPADDLGPGIAPAQVALTSAGLARNLLRFAEAFFQHGAIPAMLLTTDQTIREEEPELQRISSFWKRLFGGVSHAWETAVLGKGLKPTVLTPPVRDLVIPELSDEVREDLAACFGIPITMLQQAAANYATAREDRQSGYTDTFLPEAGRIFEGANQQLWRPLGWELRVEPSEIEVLQQDEAEKAAGVTALMEQVNKQYDGRLLTRGRAVYLVEQMWGQMGMKLPENLPDEEPEEAAPQPANLPTEPTGEPPEAEGQPKPLAPEMVEAQQAMQEAASRLRKDLAKWQVKAKKRGGDCPFSSDAIPAWVAKAVHHRLLTDPATAFAPFTVAGKQYPMGGEQALARAIEDVYAGHLDAITAAIRRGVAPDLAAMNTQLRGALIESLQERMADRVLSQASDLAWGVDYDDLLAHSEDWARERADEVIRLTSHTNDERISRILGQLEAGEIEPDVAESMIERLFGARRAQGIASYETTMALSRAAHELRDDMSAQGVQTVMRWETAEDERVCDECGPLDHTIEDVWGEMYPDGPPAHHGCRCLLNVEYARRAA